MRKGNERLSWVDFLTRKFNGQSEPPADEFTEMAGRTRLAARARWLLLGLISLYGVCAGGSFYFSSYGFFLSAEQVLFLFISIAAVIVYNTLFQHFANRVSSLLFGNHLQILLDFLFVTILIHFSGGAASWFWPVYLIVTIEAAFLLETPRDVWCIGATASLLYCTLLALENLDLLPYVPMPFVDDGLRHDSHFILLMTLWVVLVNGATVIIANFFVSVIRREAKLVKESEERLVNFLDTANDLVHCTDLDGALAFANRAMRETLGLGQEALGTSRLLTLIDEEYREYCGAEISRVVAGERPTTIESVFVTSDGREIHVEGSITCGLKEGEPVALWGIWRDITERKQYQAKLYKLAHHDNLTGLPNRILFIDRLKQAMALANRHKKLAALLFLDLDRFKVINDTLGHPLGDKLLQAAARRLTSCIRETDSLARFGGDEYTIILGDLERVEDAERVAHKILGGLAKPYHIDGHELFVTASIGISSFPRDSEELDNLIKKADIAMYHAKKQGGSRYLLYDPAMDEHAHKRLVLENNLRKALEKDEFLLYYQPKVNIATNSITAMEALLRWDHPQFGLVSPNDFIPLAEETGLILPIGAWVLEKACRQNLEWQESGLPKMRVAVNLSGCQLQQKNFLEMVKATLEKTGLDPRHLELEITETVIMQHPDFIIRILSELQEMGIHISVDDFGTGYSSLAHLKRFSVNTLKIDKSFVQDVESSRTDAAIATAIIAMGNSLNLKVIAEGVETEGQYCFLQKTMCDEVQGYLVSRPLPAGKVADFVRSRRWERLGRARNGSD